MEGHSVLRGKGILWGLLAFLRVQNRPVGLPEPVWQCRGMRSLSTWQTSSASISPVAVGGMQWEVLVRGPLGSEP